VATDVEFQGQEELPAAFRAFSRNADYALIDAQFTPEEYEHHKGWGHGTWKSAVAAVQQCNVKQAVLIHHAPERSDAEIRSIQDVARGTCSKVIAGAQGMSWSGPA
jgi:ribonuclease BN (tRNA processing enzyme)